MFIVLYKYYIFLKNYATQVAFLVYRPVMRLFKRMSGSEICWPLDIIEHSNIQSAENEVEPSDSSNDVGLDLGSPRKPIM